MTNRVDLSQIRSHVKELERLSKYPNVDPQEVAAATAKALEAVVQALEHANTQQQFEQRNAQFPRR